MFKSKKQAANIAFFSKYSKYQFGAAHSTLKRSINSSKATLP